MQDNSYDICVVDIPAQRVYLVPEKSLDEQGRLPGGYVPAEYETFQSYSLLPDSAFDGVAA